MTLHLGKVRPGTTLYIPFDTFAGATGASITMTGLAVTDIEIYKNGSTTQRASDTGYTLLDTDGIDFDALTGIHGFSVDLSSNADAGFFVAGGFYWVVVSAITVDSQTVSFVAATFSLGYEGSIIDTTIATLASQTSFTLTAGPAEDDALNGCTVIIHDIASAVQLGKAIVSDYTGSTKTVTLVAGVTFTAAAGDNISILPPALQPSAWGGVQVVQTGDAYARLGAPAGASVSADVAAVKSDSGAIKTKTDYLPSATAGAAGGVFIAGTNAATSVTTALTANITGNLSGSVGSVTGAVGSVTGAVGSVTGAVGSVTGNVGGNVTGSVGSVAANGITATSIATDAINAAAVKADAVTKIQNGLATPTNITAGTITTVTNLTNAPTAGDFTATMKTSLNAATPASVTGAVGSVTAGVTVTTNNDKTGYGLSSAAVQAIWDALTSALTTVGSIGKKLADWVIGTTQTGDTYALANGASGFVAIKADTAAILIDTAEIGAAGAGLTALATQASVNTIDDFLDTEIAAIKAKTDNLPASPAATGDIPTAAANADAVWDEAIAGHLGAGSTGAALNSAGSAGDPWGTALPGAYGAGTAGKIVGDNLNATVSSRSSHSAADVWAAVTRTLTAASDSSGITTLLSRIVGTLAAGTHEPQSGDAYARIGAAGAGLTALGDTRIANLDAAVSTRAVAGDAMALTAGERTTLTAAIWAYVIEGTHTAAQYMRLFAAALLGKLSGAATATNTFRDTGDTKDRIVATVDADGNRSAVTLDGS